LSPDAESLLLSKSVSVIKGYRPPQRSLIAPMVEGSLVANLKNWARRSTRKGRIVAKQSRRTSQQHPTTTDEAEQSQRAMTVSVEQSRRTSSVSQPLAATSEAEQYQRVSSVAPKIATAAETEQSRRTSFCCCTNVLPLLPTDTMRSMTSETINRHPP
jgi:hypothetical protein